jgi:S-DNA-T family DNA segregation ATPase FtsK/SpoIIIE
MLIAGRSGAGKSWSARPLLFDASEGPANVLVIIDLKKVEARNWEHRARTASTPEDVIAVVAELVAEMLERLDLVPRGEDTITPTAERPRITVFVDEGAEVVTAAKAALVGLESIARMGRAACIDLWWATQKPTMSGSSPGIPAQIAPQLSTVVSLAVSTPTEARTVLGEDAQAKGWDADELPAPGYALVRSGPKSKPNPIKTRALSPKQVVALPDRPIWSREISSEELAAASVPVSVDDMDLTDNQRAVFKAVQDGGETNAAIAKVTGLNPGSVARVITRLENLDLVVKDGKTIRLGGAA